MPKWIFQKTSGDQQGVRVRLEYNSLTQDSGESVNLIEKTDLNLFSMIHLLRLKVHVSFLKLDSKAITRLASPRTQGIITKEYQKRFNTLVSA